MTVESNYAKTITTLCDWLRNLAPVFQPIIREPKPITPCTRDFSRVLCKLQIISRNSDWVIALFSPVVIAPRNYFVLVLRQSFGNRSKNFQQS